MCVMEPFLSCLQKQEELKTLFALSTSTDLTYQKMIELGRRLPPYPEELKQEEKIVLGCQEIKNESGAAQCMAAAAGELVFQNYAGWRESVKEICSSLSGRYREECSLRVEQVKQSYGRN